MIEKTASHQNIDKIDVYIEDTKPEYFNIFDLTNYLPVGKSSFLIDVPKDVFVQGTEVKVELLDSDGNPIYIDIPKYREGAMRRVSIWVYPNNTNGIANLTIIGELKNVPKEWQGMYNVRYTTTVTINKALSNTQPIRFYNTPSASISEYRKYYLSRSWVGGEKTTVTGEKMEIKVSDKGEYLFSTTEGDFDYQYKDATLTIDGQDPVKIKSVKSTKLAVLELPYAFNSPYAGLSNTNFSIEYNNEPTYSATENFQSYAKVDLTNINPFSGEIQKAKTFLRSKGAFDSTEYTLINEVKFNKVELLVDPELTGSLGA